MYGQTLVYFALIMIIGYLASALDQPVVNGQTVVAGLFDIHKSTNGPCATLSVSEIQSLEAVRWVFEQLNNQIYLPGGIGEQLFYIFQRNQKNSW